MKILAILVSLLMQLSCSGTNAELAARSDAFVDSIGVNTHLGGAPSDAGSTYAKTALMQTELGKSGIRHIRDGGTLGYISDGSYVNMAAIAAATGVTYDLSFDPRFITATQAHIESVVAAIGSSNMEAIEGPNEYDLSGDPSWAADATAYQSSLYTAVKTDSNPAISALPVYSWSVGNQGNSSAAGNQTASINYGNMHSYPGGNNPGAGGLAGYIGNVKLMCTTKPFVSTETGYNTNPTTSSQDVSEAAQGKYIPRMYLEQWNAGVVRMYDYDFADDHVSTADSDHWGLIHTDGTEKPAFTTLSNMIAILSDKGAAFTPGNLYYLLGGSIGNIHHTLLQKRTGRFELVLWIETASYNLGSHTDIVVPTQAVTVNQLSNLHTANIYDPSISSSVQSSPAIAGGSVSVTVKDSPIILELIP